VLSARSIRKAGLGASALVAAMTLAGCSSSNIGSNFRFGWPTGVTKQAERMERLWEWSTVAALVVGVMVWGLIFWCCIRYRKTDDQMPKQTKMNHRLEIVYTIIPVIIVLVLFYFTATTQNYVTKLTKNPDTTVEVVAFQWNWQFNYCDQPYTGDTTTSDQDKCIDGTYVHTTGSAEQIPILVIPRGETVRVIEHSTDVIHSFWVPDFLFKRDVIPQPIDNQFEFTATTNGSYVGRCAELCGTYHSQMNFEVRVVDPDVYKNYLSALASYGGEGSDSQANALTAVDQGPYATTTHPFDTDRTTRSASEPK
jgi:cytochrome c oxidase subunit 2